MVCEDGMILCEDLKRVNDIVERFVGMKDERVSTNNK